MELKISADTGSWVIKDAVKGGGDDGIDIEEHDAVELGPLGYAKFGHDFGVAVFGVDPVCGEAFDFDDVGAVLDEALAFGMGNVARYCYDEGYVLSSAGLRVVEELVGEDTGADEVDIVVVGLSVVDCGAGEEGDECVFWFLGIWGLFDLGVGGSR